jgi:hypothetical protein
MLKDRFNAGENFVTRLPSPSFATETFAFAEGDVNLLALNEYVDPHAVGGPSFPSLFASTSLIHRLVPQPASLNHSCESFLATSSRGNCTASSFKSSVSISGLVPALAAQT